MAKRISRAKKKRYVIIIASISVVVIGIGAAFFLTVRQIRNKYELENAALSKRIEQNQRLVYRATTAIPAGSVITEENISQVLVPSDMDDSLYMTEDMIGKIAIMDIAQGQDIMKVMVGTADLFSVREVEYAMLTLNNNLKKDDFVDIRIMFPNGENATVVRKACVKKVNHERNEIFFWLDETSIMNMSSAIVDVYLHEGAIIYTTRYVEDGQDAIEVNYQPSSDVMVAIANDPNIVGEAATAVTEKMNATLRDSLEKRLDKFRSKKATSTPSGIDLSGTVVNGSGADNSKEEEEAQTQQQEEKLNDNSEDFSYGE